MAISIERLKRMAGAAKARKARGEKVLSPMERLTLAREAKFQAMIAKYSGMGQLTEK